MSGPEEHATRTSPPLADRARALATALTTVLAVAAGCADTAPDGTPGAGGQRRRSGRGRRGSGHAPGERGG